LVDAIENRQLWAHRYESELTSLFAIQDRIALEVVTGLQVEIAEGEQERIALVHGTKNLQAWLIGGQALQHLRRLMRADNARARALYQQASEIDPAYPGAWDGLAWTHIIDARFGWSPDPTESIRVAAALAERTLVLDAGRPASYALLGTVALARGRHAEAIAFAEKGVALSPNGADVTAVLALILTYSGEPRRAIDLLRRAMRLSPYYPAWYRWTLGRAYRLLGDADQAIAALMPDDVPAGGSVAPLVELTASYVQAGKLEAARSVATRVVAEAQKFSVRAWVAMPPYRDAAVAENERALLGRAGLPD
jgi:tetratricopeptide (TPR) repeat protein